jgi:hypothetical protein
VHDGDDDAPQTVSSRLPIAYGTDAQKEIERRELVQKGGDPFDHDPSLIEKL